MRIVLAGVFLLVAGPAQAETYQRSQTDVVVPRAPTMFDVGAPVGGTLVKSTIDLHDETGGIRATWTLQFANDAKVAGEVSIPLYVTPDVAVTGMSLWSQTQDPFFADGYIADDAARTFDKMIARAKDPALLQCTTTCETLKLRVFPVSRGAPAVVKIELWMPGGNSMSFDAGRHREKKWHTFSGLPAAEPEAIRALSKDQSLVAGPHL